MVLEDELYARNGAPDRGVEEATANVLPQEHAEKLHRILSRHVNAFRRALGEDPLREWSQRKSSSNLGWML